MAFSILSHPKRNEKWLCLTGKTNMRAERTDIDRWNSRLDLDAWINDPPSESEDEAVPASTRQEFQSDRSLFSGGDQSESYYHGSNLDTQGADGGSGYSRSTTYVEPSTEELEQQRESRKQSEKLNPFYLKDSGKAKAAKKVSFLDAVQMFAHRYSYCRMKSRRVWPVLRRVRERRRHPREVFLPVYKCLCPINCIVNRKSTRRIGV